MAKIANRISLMAQNDAHEKIVEQAEQHRVALEKEFTLSLERLKAENQKTIDEAVKARNEFAKLCQPASYDNEDIIQRVEGKSGH